jgi:hypothetical protein
VPPTTTISARQSFPANRDDARTKKEAKKKTHKVAKKKKKMCENDQGGYSQKTPIDLADLLVQLRSNLADKLCNASLCHHHRKVQTRWRTLFPFNQTPSASPPSFFDSFSLSRKKKKNISG